MKKWIAMLLAGCMVAAMLAGCGSTADEGGTEAKDEYVYLDEVLGKEQYAIGFRKDDTELCELVNAGLDAMAANGTFDEIGKKYPEIYDFLTLNKEVTADDSAETAAPEIEGKYGKGFVFKHGFDQDYPPYSHIGNDGKTTGFDVELAQAVCDYYGWKYEPVPFNWDAKDAELKAGSCDCIWSGFTINGREDDYLWSKPYSDNDQMIMVKKDSGIKTLEDLAGKTVGVQTSTSAYDMLNEGDQKALKDTFASLEVYESYTIAFNDLKAGAIDAIAIDVTSGNHLMSGQ